MRQDTTATSLLCILLTTLSIVSADAVYAQSTIRPTTYSPVGIDPPDGFTAAANAIDSLPDPWQGQAMGSAWRSCAQHWCALRSLEKSTIWSAAPAGYLVQSLTVSWVISLSDPYHYGYSEDATEAEVKIQYRVNGGTWQNVITPVTWVGSTTPYSSGDQITTIQFNPSVQSQDVEVRGYVRSTVTNCHDCSAPDYTTITAQVQIHDIRFTAVPETAMITARTFIRYDHVDHPIWSTSVFEGDKRTYCESCGSHRIFQQIVVYNPLTSPSDIASGPFKDAGITQEYEKATSLDQNGEITATAKDDWEEGAPLKLAWGITDLDDTFCTAQRVGSTPTNVMHIDCVASASNPLITWAPKIDVQYEITLTFGTSTTHYVIEGCHDGFPSYELYIKNVPLVNHQDNGDPLSLFPPCDVSVSIEGDIQ